MPNCSNIEEYKVFHANDDISGPGVLIGFVGTGYLTFFVLLAHFLVSYDPESYPFDAGHAAASGAAKPRWWKANAIDIIFLSWVRGLASRLPRVVQISEPRRLEHVFNRAILSMCDIQLLNGLGILIAGFISLEGGLQAYDWQILVYVAWFASVTHLSGLTVIRHYLSRHPTEIFIRYALMALLLIMLVVAIVPTGLFNWVQAERFGMTWSSAAIPPSPAICFFDISSRRKLNNWFSYDDGYGGGTKGWIWGPSPWFKPLSSTAALQAMVFSIILLVFGFITRSIRLFKAMSMALQETFRKPVSTFVQESLMKLGGTTSETSSLRRRAQFVLFVRPLLAIFLAVRINVDLFGSMLAELFWLMVLLAWGTVRLWEARRSVSDDLKVQANQEHRWAFGQILSALLLVAPIWSMIGTFTQEHKGSPPVSIPSETAQAQAIGFDDLQDTLIELDPYLTLPSNTASDNHIPSWITRDYYRTAPWLNCCLFLARCTVVGFTLVLFWLVESDVGGFTLVEFWITELGILFTFIVVYPCLCQVTMLYGLWMDDWLCDSHVPRRWQKRRRCLFGSGAFAIWLVCMILWMMEQELSLATRIGLELGACGVLNVIHFVGNMSLLRRRSS